MPADVHSEQSLQQPQQVNRSWLQAVLEDVPMINFVYDFIFDAVPTENGLKDTLNLLGLIDALILGFAISILTAVDFDELTAADDRFRTATSGYPLGYHQLFMSEDLGQASVGNPLPSAQYCVDTFFAIVWLFVSLLAVLMVYFDFINKTFEGDTKRLSNIMFLSWWRYAKWCVAFCLTGTVAGVYLAATVVISIIVIKFPDEHIATHGTMNKGLANPIGCYIQNSSIIVCTLLIVLILLGIGTKKRFAEEKVHKDKYKIVCLDDAPKWQLIFQKLANVIEKEDIDDFIDGLISQGVKYSRRECLTGDHLKDMGVMLLGHRIEYLSCINESLENMSNNVTDIGTSKR